MKILEITNFLNFGIYKATGYIPCENQGPGIILESPCFSHIPVDSVISVIVT